MSSPRGGRQPYGLAEALTARLAVTGDAHRPLSGPLRRPALAATNAAYRLSWVAHEHRWIGHPP